MRALVTGACGFAGGHLVRHLLECGDEVLAGVLKSEVSGIAAPTVRLDVTDLAQVRDVLQRFAPDVVYHLAAIAFVPEAEEDFERVLRVNVAAVHHITRTCHLLQRNISLVLVSSSEVYGKIRASELPVRESTPLRPHNNYSLTKVMAEAVLSRYRSEGSVRATIVRPFNHIGPGQDDRFVASSFARQIARMKRGLAEPILRVGDLSPRRDFSDVRDIVRGYRLAAQRGSGIYNLASGRAIPIRTIVDILQEVSGVQVKVEVDQSRVRPLDVPEIVGSYELAEQELGWRPQIELKQTLRDVFEYWYARGG